jgi:HEAT repeat protein
MIQRGALKSKLTSKSATERYLATVEIARLRDPWFVPFLRESFENDPDGSVCQNAARALGQIGTADAGQVLVSFLRRNFSLIRRYSDSELRLIAAAEALGDTKHPEAISLLTAVFEEARSTNQGVAGAAKSGLIACKGSSALWL